LWRKPRPKLDCGAKERKKALSTKYLSHKLSISQNGFRASVFVFL